MKFIIILVRLRLDQVISQRLGSFVLNHALGEVFNVALFIFKVKLIVQFAGHFPIFTEVESEDVVTVVEGTVYNRLWNVYLAVHRGKERRFFQFLHESCASLPVSVSSD